MGVIARNGKYYGGESSQDVTVYSTMEEFEQETNPLVNHLYIIENSSYYWDGEQLISVGADKAIEAEEYTILSSNGNGWAEENIGKFYIKKEDNCSIIETPATAIGIRSSTETLEQNYWGNPQNNVKLYLKGAPLLQMIQENEDAPVLSMRGKGIIDVFGGENSRLDCQDETFISRMADSCPNWMSEKAYEVYSSSKSPFSENKEMSEDQLIYPLLSLKHCATIQATDTALVQFTGGSSLQVGGNAEVVIHGSGCDDEHLYEDYGRTKVYLRPGSKVYMQSDGKTTPLAFIESGGTGGKILFSTDAGLNSEVDDSIHYWRPMEHLITSLGHNHNIFTYPKTWIEQINTVQVKDYFYNNNSPEYDNATLNIEGKTNINIGDAGNLGIKIGPKNENSYLMITFDPNENTKTNLKMGCDAGSAEEWLIGSDEDAFQCVKFGTNSQSESVINFTPNGKTSVNFAPEQVCGISFTPKSTDIICQWDHLTGIFEGTDAFLQIEGQTHQESLDGSVLIQRGYSEQPINIADTIVESKDNYRKVKTTIYTQQNYTSFEDFYNELQNNIFDINKFLFTNNIMHYNSLSASQIPIEYSNAYVEKEESRQKAMYWTRLSTATNILKFVFYCQFEQEYEENELKEQILNKLKTDFYFYHQLTGSYEFQLDSIKKLGHYKKQYYYQCQVILRDAETLACLTFNSYLPGSSYADMFIEDKMFIKDQIHLTDYSFENVVVCMPTDRYALTFSYPVEIQHLGINWARPIQQSDNNRVTNGSIIQTYDKSNLLMRSNSPDTTDNEKNIIVTTSHDYTNLSSNQYELIEAFMQSNEYESFISSLTFGEGYEYWEITFIEVLNASSLSINYTFKKVNWEPHLISTDSPVLEMTGQSELRLYDDIFIQGEVKYGVPIYTFGDSTKANEQVSFTLDELKKIKSLLNSVPIQVVNDGTEATEQNILYFINNNN